MRGSRNACEALRVGESLSVRRISSGGLGAVASPPYDVIDAAGRAALLRRSPYNDRRRAQDFVANPAAMLAKIKELKGEGRRNAHLMVAGASGDLRFVALPLE